MLRNLPRRNRQVGFVIVELWMSLTALDKTTANCREPSRASACLGVPVRLHFTFLLLLIFLLVTVLGSHQSGGQLRAVSARDARQRAAA